MCLGYELGRGLAESGHLHVLAFPKQNQMLFMVMWAFMIFPSTHTKLSHSPVVIQGQRDGKPINSSPLSSLICEQEVTLGLLGGWNETVPGTQQPCRQKGNWGWLLGKWGTSLGRGLLWPGTTDRIDGTPRPTGAETAGSD